MPITAVGWSWPRRKGFTFTEAEFAPTFGRTSREIIAHLWGEGRYDDAQIAELDRRKEAAFRRLIEADFPAMPGASELLRSLHDAGFRLAVGSSGPPENVDSGLGPARGARSVRRGRHGRGRYPRKARSPGVSDRGQSVWAFRRRVAR